MRKNTSSHKITDNEVVFKNGEFKQASTSFNETNKKSELKINTVQESLDYIVCKIPFPRKETRSSIEDKIESLREDLNNEVSKGYIDEKVLEISRKMDGLINEYNRLYIRRINN